MTRIKWFNCFILVGFLVAAPVYAQDIEAPTTDHGLRFVDLNGDGINDNAPDVDGDGIPNGLDPDYQGLQRKGGTGGFIDLDGDGINDNAPDVDGDGIPNGMDADYQGSQMQFGARGFVDLDGDGINDNAVGRRGSIGTAFGAGRSNANPAGAALRAGNGESAGPQGNMQRIRANGRSN